VCQGLKDTLTIRVTYDNNRSLYSHVEGRAELNLYSDDDDLIGDVMIMRRTAAE